MCIRDRVHTVKATPANVHDVSETSKLLTGAEEAVYGDSGYPGAGKREDADVYKRQVLCTTGIGMSITANKIDGIRCALLSDPWSAKMTRLHNDTNMICLLYTSGQRP